MNVNKLKGKIVENGLNIEKLASKMNVDKSTLYRKINREGENFTVSEVNQIVTILELSPQEIMEIFFKNYVA